MEKYNEVMRISWENGEEKWGITPRQDEGEIEKLRQQNAELVDALKTVHIWVVRWTGHVGRCDGGLKCTCGRTRAIYEAEAALAKETGGE